MRLLFLFHFIFHKIFVLFLFCCMCIFALHCFLFFPMLPLSSCSLAFVVPVLSPQPCACLHIPPPYFCHTLCLLPVCLFNPLLHTLLTAHTACHCLPPHLTPTPSPFPTAFPDFLSVQPAPHLPAFLSYLPSPTYLPLPPPPTPSSSLSWVGEGGGLWPGRRGRRGEWEEAAVLINLNRGREWGWRGKGESLPATCHPLTLPTHACVAFTTHCLPSLCCCLYLYRWGSGRR